MGVVEALASEKEALEVRLLGLEDETFALYDRQDQIDAFEDQDPSFLARGSTLDNFPNLDKLGQTLEAKAGVSIASYQRISSRKKQKEFVVSKAKAAAYRTLKKAGTAEFRSITLPSLPVLQPDATLLAAPQDLIGSDGLNYLEARGYLQTNGSAQDYYCKRRDAALRMNGIEPAPKECKSGFYRETYTVLGPIEVPSRLCGANSVAFFLPEGVPEPVGKLCHSFLVRLEDTPCLENEFHECPRGRR